MYNPNASSEASSASATMSADSSAMISYSNAYQTAQSISEDCNDTIMSLNNDNFVIQKQSQIDSVQSLQFDLASMQASYKNLALSLADEYSSASVTYSDDTTETLGEKLAKQAVSNSASQSNEIETRWNNGNPSAF